MSELWTFRMAHTGPWCGNFNLIYKVEDKNNARLNHRLMRAFRSFLDELELAELLPHRRLYTWSNEQAHPNAFAH
jgi:hypothetical protein